MKKFSMIILTGMVISLFLMAFAANAARIPAREYKPSGPNPEIDLSVPLVITVAGDTVWVVADKGCGDDDDVPGEAVFCFEDQDTCPGPGGVLDPYISGRCFYHMDKRADNENYWNVHYQVYPDTIEGEFDNNVAWCGSEGTEFWLLPPGYGPDWNDALVLSLDPVDFDSMTVVDNGFDVSSLLAYDCEFEYDYCYLEYTMTEDVSAYPDGWTPIDTFNATSDGAGGEAEDYLNPRWNNYAVHVDVPAPADFNQLRIRWRFYSDGAWDDEDGRGDTNGAYYIDDVLVTSTAKASYGPEDFETGFGPEWEKAGFPVVEETWAIRDNPDPPYAPNGFGFCDTMASGNDSWQWNCVPGPPYDRIGYFHQFSMLLLAPKVYTVVPTSPGGTGRATGMIAEYDQYMCCESVFSDYTDTICRYYTASGWSPWQNIDGYITYGGCTFWNINDGENLSQWLGPDVDSIQFAWELMDLCNEGEFCWNFYHKTKKYMVDYIIDEVSFGIYDGQATAFSARTMDFLQDTFDTLVDAHSQALENDDLDPTHVFSLDESLTVNVNDYNGLASVDLVFQYLDENDVVIVPAGGGWITKPMNLSDPVAGTYAETITPADCGFGDGTFDPGMECWYYMVAQDMLGNFAYYPRDAHPDSTHEKRGDRYWEYSIFPFPKPAGEYAKILLVDHNERNHYELNHMEICPGTSYDYDGVPIDARPHEETYQVALECLGYDNKKGYDKFDINSGSTNRWVDPYKFVEYDELGVATSSVYDVIIWFSGRNFDTYTVWDSTTIELNDFVKGLGGDLWLSGDGIAAEYLPISCGYPDASPDSMGAATGGGCPDGEPTYGRFTYGICGITCDPAECTQSHPPTLEDRACMVNGVAGTIFEGVALPLWGDYVGDALIIRDFSIVNPAGPTEACSWANPSQVMTYGAQTTPPYPVGCDDGCPDAAGEGAVVANWMLADLAPGEVGRTMFFGFEWASLADGAGRLDIMDKILHGSTALGGFGWPAPPRMYVGTPPAQSSGYATALMPNHPNPFNPKTTIRFSMGGSGPVELSVYNVMGQKVATLVNEFRTAGLHEVTWDGTNGRGYEVSGGVYFFRMSAGDFMDTKKMVLVK